MTVGLSRGILLLRVSYNCGEMRIIYQVVVGRCQTKRHCETRCVWEFGMKLGGGETGCGRAGWIKLYEDMVHVCEPW